MNNTLFCFFIHLFYKPNIEPEINLFGKCIIYDLKIYINPDYCSIFNWIFCLNCNNPEWPFLFEISSNINYQNPVCHKVCVEVWRNIPCLFGIRVTASTNSLAVEMGCQLLWGSCMWLQLEHGTKRGQNRRIIGCVLSSVKILACCYTIWWDKSKLHPWTAFHPSIFYTSLFLLRVMTSWCLHSAVIIWEPGTSLTCPNFWTSYFLVK